ncbi:hypothetical protein GGR50DRAFT_704424 [Xylaria sp. CBS 124048]|nr:hypothetical protein GGR50DRAFT_704424 [Xylaria sp. CBS 124048]
MSEYRVDSPRRQRACLPCTKAKARCHYENNEVGEGCDRCLRFKIACTPQTTKSLRRPRRVKVRDVSDGVNISNSPSQSHRELENGPGDAREFGVELATTVRTVSHNSRPSPSASPALSDGQTGPGFGITWDQAQKAVDDFAMIFTAHFPFLILDHDITASQLFVEKPLLLQVILMIAIDLSPAKSCEIKRSVDKWIGEHLLAVEEPSLSILQGLIVYISWANPHFHSDSRATQLMYLAVGLVHRLGISRRAMADDSQVKTERDINEEYRAFLACYYVLSFNSFQFGRLNPLSSSHVQYCVDSLGQSAEFPTDFLLIKMIKFRQFVARIPNVYEGLHDMRWNRDISADISHQLSERRKELDDIMADVSHKHHKFLLLWNLHHCAFIQLYIPMTYVVTNIEATSLLRLECMEYCLQVSRTFENMTKSISPDGILYAPFTTLADMISMLIAMSRLLLVNIKGWDTDAARQNSDLKTQINVLIAKVVEARRVKAKRVAATAMEYHSGYTQVDPNEEKQDRLQIYIRLLESIRSWLNAQGVFLTEKVDNFQGDIHDTLPSPTSIHVSPQSPQWTYTFFFESILQMDRASSS